MLGAFALVFVALITAILCLMAGYRWRHNEHIRFHWSAWLIMALGAVAIGAFYVGVIDLTLHGQNILALIPFSRFLFWTILITTSIMALGVILSDGDNRE